jgi:hypothetical protein
VKEKYNNLFFKKLEKRERRGIWRRDNNICFRKNWEEKKGKKREKKEEQQEKENPKKMQETKWG